MPQDGMVDRGGQLASRASLLKAASLLGVSIAASLVLLPSFEITADPTYAAVTAGILAGVLLTVRLRSSEPGGSLVIVPVLVAHVRYGAAALPALAVASVTANLLRTRSIAAGLTIGAQDILSFALAQTGAEWLAAVSHSPVGPIGFALIFALSRSTLSRLARRLGVPAGAEPTIERPDALLTLLIAPLSALPIHAWLLLGDAAFLLAMASLLALLTVVREAVNLATARVEAEAERDRWQRAYTLQEELIQLMTHEVRNPLTIILTYCDLIVRAAPGPARDLEKDLGRIRQAGQSIARLVDNLLQISRLEGRQQLPSSESVDPGLLARVVMQEMEPLAEQKAQTLTLEASERTPRVMVPRALLHEALTNLVSNAVKYTPRGGTITVWTRPAPDGTAVLGVTDTGVGLSEEDLGHLFTKFFRSVDPRVRRERGVGLGLALTRSIVERMGGRVTVESSLNEGTTFTIQLPSVGQLNPVDV